MLNNSIVSKIIEKYTYVPSAILMRIAEVSILQNVHFARPILDLCCGDGFIASLLFEEVDAGCDFSKEVLNEANRCSIYKELVFADITKQIPFDDNKFNTVFSNSALEHVSDIKATLKNINRVMAINGKLVFTLASNYAYEWWPCSEKAKKRYMKYQPVYNYFSLEEWKEYLEMSGMQLVEHTYYLSKPMSKLMFFIDYHHSNVCMTKNKTFARFCVRIVNKIPKKVLKFIWRCFLVKQNYEQGKRGGGICIIAKKVKEIEV